MSKNNQPKGDKKRVSYSQFSNWFKCRHRWYLDKVKGLSEFEDSINTCFGTAIHEAVQLYVETLYTKGVIDADSHDLIKIFDDAFIRELTRAKENSDKFDYTDEQLAEFRCDGDDVLNAFLNITNRMKNFPTNKYEFIAVEDEIIMPVKNNVEFICYIDIVLKEKGTGRYRIIDIKTSTQAWNQYQREDVSKIAQVLLYKAFYHRKYNVPIDMIDVEFLILKRKLYENMSFPQSRIQNFIPKNNQREVAKAVNLFGEFVAECFTKDGKYIDDPKVYLKNPGKGKKNCKYCPHKKINCDAKSDILTEEL